ncbi:MAG: TIGR02452 family protein [Thermoanaerobaculia bacterium]
MAASRRRELRLPREVAAALGRSAVAAIERGSYTFGAAGSVDGVDWRDAVRTACGAKVSLPPAAPLPAPGSRRCARTRIQVRNETTLAAARPLAAAGLKPLALNFANGIHPGGGFLHGARAQEEALCRSSALYATLVGDEMYAAHRQRSRPDSTDWAIYSPDVPVFRTDDGTELEQPWLLSVVTCAAPYAPTVGQPESGDLLQRRIHRLLAIARAFGHPVLVLGAWGCGDFGNDPHRTARDFRQAFESEFDGAFSEVVFAIIDWSPERKTLGPFRDAFAATDK